MQNPGLKTPTMEKFMGKIKIFSIHDNNLGIIPAGKLLFDEKQQLHVPPTFDP